MEVDSDYEFNAPKYIDFLSHDDDNENLDKWFDENPEGHEGGVRFSQAFFDYHHSNYQQATQAISAALRDEHDANVTPNTAKVGEVIKQEECSSSAKDHQESESMEIAEKTEPVASSQGCCTNEEQKVKHEQEIEQDSAANRNIDNNQTKIAEESCEHQGMISQGRNDDCQKEEYPVNLEIVKTEKSVEVDKTEGLVPEVNVEVNGVKTADENVVQTETQPRRITRSNSLRQESKNKTLSNQRKRKSATPLRSNPPKMMISSTEQNHDVENAKKQKMDVKKPMITMPNTPSFLRRIKNKLGSNKRTSEAIEIERIKQLQKETKKRLKENETFLQKALAPQPVHQQKPITALTKTMEFHFQTDSRIKQHPMKTRSDDEMDGHKFVDQLRKHPPSPTFKNKKATKPVPFKFSSGSTSSSKPETAQTTTTTGWKSVASAVIEFQTKTPDRWRSRPASQQNNGPHVEEKTKMQLTHPKTPQLMTKRRSRPNNAQGQSDIEDKIVEEMKGYQFKAKEFDHKIVEKGGRLGLNEPQRLPLTKAKPFRFESDNRLELRKKKDNEDDVIEKNNEKYHQERSSDGPDTFVSHASRKRSHPKKTEPKPFSFETRDKEMLQKKQEKIQKIYEEEEKAREFHARPLPNLSPDPVIVKQNKPVEQAPFNLATDQRGAVRAEKWTAQIMKEREQEKEKTKFKAQPCKVVHKEAFVPKPSSKPLVEISSFKLNTEERSKKREDFEIAKKEQQRVKEDELQRILKEKQEEEEKEVMNMRKQMVHVANPVRNFAEVEIKPSEKPVTMPETPKFETNKRFGKRVSRV